MHTVPPSSDHLESLLFPRITTIVFEYIVTDACGRAMAQAAAAHTSTTLTVADGLGVEGGVSICGWQKHTD
eukprot:COSAG02_NODE_2566_length_8519_cov_3.109857_12_plen_71_part_00